MTKTLADMTAEERAECVGMWCDNLASTADTPQPVVLACVQGERCWILHTDLHGEWSCFPLDRVAPRFDLPRAWTPDGEPELAQALAEETWEYSVQIKDHTGEWETATNSESHLEEWWESKKHAEWAMAEEQEFGEHCRIVRRRVSPPEVINE